MRKGKYSDEQVIAILREQEAGRPTAEICRKYGVSNATFYKWKSKFGGMQVWPLPNTQITLTSLFPSVTARKLIGACAGRKRFTPRTCASRHAPHGLRHRRLWPGAIRTRVQSCRYCTLRRLNIPPRRRARSA